MRVSLQKYSLQHSGGIGVSSQTLLLPIKKRVMSSRGFYGDTFSDGFGGFKTMKKRTFENCLKYAQLDVNDCYKR